MMNGNTNQVWRNVMKRFATNSFVCGLGLLMLMATSAYAADVPTRMGVQALLLDKSGKAVSGSFDITFSLWDKEKAGTKLWSSTQTSVLASQGLVDVILGSETLNPLTGGVFGGNAQVWLQIQILAGPGVGEDGESPLPRRPFSTVGFAFHSQTAVTAGTAANATKFDGKDMAAVQKDLLQAVTDAGFMKPGAKVDQSNLPGNGLNEVSNGLLTNQFTDKMSSKAPVEIKDFNPVGVTDTIDFPDIGVAESFSVSVNITNSDLNGVTVNLFAPDGKKYVLYDKNGPGTVLGTSYPAPTTPKSGDLGEWIGKNPQGKWQLQVIDLAFNEANAGTDGQINSWSISISNLSTKKVKVNGDLLVNGGLNLQGTGTIDLKGDLIMRNPDGKIVFKLDHKTGAVSLLNGGKFAVLDTNGKTFFQADPVAGNLTSTMFPPGSTPYLYGYINDFTNGNWVYKSQASYGHSIPVDDKSLHSYVDQVVYGDKLGNMHRSMSSICRANDSNCRTQQVLVAFIKNTTENEIQHSVRYRCATQAAVSNYAGLAINGNSVWNSSSNDIYSDNNHSVTFPKNQTSVLVLKCGSYRWDQWNGYYMKSIIGFHADTMQLKAGLEFDYDRYHRWVANK